MRPAPEISLRRTNFGPAASTIRAKYRLHSQASSRIVVGDIGAQAYIVACPGDKAIYRDGPFTLEHRPKPMPNVKGLRYHVAEIFYGFGLLLTALRFRANLAVLDPVIHCYIMSLFQLAGIKTAVVLHSTLWPTGFPPSRRVQRMIARLDSAFCRRLPIATIGVWPECIRAGEATDERETHAALSDQGSISPRGLSSDSAVAARRSACISDHVYR